MEKTDLAKLLGIDEKHIDKEAIDQKICFRIHGASVKTLNLNLLRLNITLEFIRCNFAESIFLYNKSIKTQLSFLECIFNEALRIGESIFEEDFVCTSSYFEREVNFLSTSFKRKVDFSSTEFKAKTNFNFSSFQGETSFIGTKFLAQSLEYENCEYLVAINYDNDFRRVVFEEKVYFSNTRFSGKTGFDDSSFHKTVTFDTLPIFELIEFEDISFARSTFHQDVSFMFVKIKRASFYGTNFKANVTFEQVTFQESMGIHNLSFEKDVYLTQVSFGGCVDFFNVVFEANLFMHQRTRFENSFLVSRAEFRGETKFEDVVFEKDAVFEGTIFNEISFARTIFRSKAKFNSANFHKKVDFIDTDFNETSFPRTGFYGEINLQRCIFNKNLSFNQTTFTESLDFLDCSFGRQFDIHHHRLQYSYLQLKQYLDQADKKARLEKPIIWRDLFRKLKSNRLAYHNLIDASELRAQELYAREIELDSKDSSIFSQDWIEKWQLWFYRHTSDHHTDLMRIISWVIIAIGAFGLTFFWAKCIQNPSTFSHLNPYAVNLSLWGTIFLLIPYLAGWIKSFFIFAGSVGLIPILWIVCYKPSLIFGAVNLLEKNSKYSGLENIILAIYTLIMILLLFSLQKTARKNSIIPN